MSIRRWHWGKLIILWAWGGAASLLAMTDFQVTPVEQGPVRHLVELLFAVAVLLLLSVLTWRWLGDRVLTESKDENGKQ
jgi:hypothetical protein